MTRIRFAALSWAMIAIVGAALLSAPSLAADEKKEEAKKQDEKKGLEFSAVILPPAGSSNITPSEITIRIDRFTTPEEKQALRSILEKEGQSATLTAAQKNTIGRLIRAGGRGVDILYAAKESTDKGERIVIVTPRAPIYPNTIMNAHTMEFPFTVAWFTPVADGKGEGTILGATTLKMKPTGEVDVKAYRASVANLANVKAR